MERRDLYRSKADMAHRNAARAGDEILHRHWKEAAVRWAYLAECEDQSASDFRFQIAPGSQEQASFAFDRLR
jgi:hypothetical protein